MNARVRLVRLVLAAALVAAAGAAWTGYRQPAFLLQLATAAWLCN